MPFINILSTLPLFRAGQLLVLFTNTPITPYGERELDLIFLIIAISNSLMSPRSLDLGAVQVMTNYRSLPISKALTWAV